MPAKKTKEIESYDHHQERRANNPPVGLVNPDTDPDSGIKSRYRHDPHIDPEIAWDKSALSEEIERLVEAVDKADSLEQARSMVREAPASYGSSLEWAGKRERPQFEVPLVSLHRHERIDPRSILAAVRKKFSGGGGNNSLQLGFFETERNTPLREAVEFYRHRDNWSNRLIAGDSLLVMNSLLAKESMAGKVQCVYMDPPYGVKYGSNFQAFVDKTDVKDGRAEDLPREPEMLKAFRDTWELGVHSYLSYMRDRLLLIRELLSESGSVFVQIGDENVHRLGLVMDEIFGAQNRVTTITYASTGGSSARTLPDVSNQQLSRREIVDMFNWGAMVELENGQCRKPTEEERLDPEKYLPKNARLYKRTDLTSIGHSTTGRSDAYRWNGRDYLCPNRRHWSISKEGLDRLAEIGRLDATEQENSQLAWRRYEEEVPGKRLNNIWPTQMYAGDKRYVVQTANSTIERCILMTTDPGDLVLDPTAHVAEQWGRRWITVDTSRVALAIARQRLMTQVYDYYRLAHPDQGIAGGFVYKEVPKVSAAILAYDEQAAPIKVYDRPQKDASRVRITGPFTVEAVPAPTVLPIHETLAEDTGVYASPDPDISDVRSGQTRRIDDWCEELQKTGIRGKDGQRIEFTRVESEPMRTFRHLHAVAETAAADNARRVLLSFGPEHAPLEPRQVEAALREAETFRPKADRIVFAAFKFDPEAAKDIDETKWPGMTILKAEINGDLHTEDLKKKRSGNESFWLIGQPDVKLEAIDSKEDLWRVEVLGFDYFDIKSETLRSGGAGRIAVWMCDSDYDGRCLYPRQVFFPMAGKNDGWAKLAKSLKAEIDMERIEAYRGTVSLPFECGEHRRVAVKIVDDRGIESLRVIDIPRPEADR
ncbi:MAG: site-specific DNA-methyltransferase [Ectothiorhodospiraceae bacterium AqS1]|nr:site-specific DNA-methyltransferase [Ectothiorhodospiraceae bacterium AqS1]